MFNRKQNLDVVSLVWAVRFLLSLYGAEPAFKRKELPFVKLRIAIYSECMSVAHDYCFWCRKSM